MLSKEQRITNFLNDIIDVYKKHQLSISVHISGRGLVVLNYEEDDIHALREAYIHVSERPGHETKEQGET